jgi:hypothetical protein
MNTAGLYAKSIGKETEPQLDPDELFQKGLEQEQRADWLRHPLTQALLQHLSQRTQELLTDAAVSADAGRDKKLINKMLIKSVAIKEITNYVTSGNNN